MLKPKINRLDYGTLLAPPDEYTLAAAVGTSYSLDFDALVGACMALGLSAETDSTLLNNPLYLLDTLRRTGDRIALFCQAGQIHAPSNASSLYILLEKIVFQVLIKKQKNHPQHPSFHPKLWLLKYTRPNDDDIYRIIILSRNLTYDRSWDVSFSMDGRKKKKLIKESKPLVDLLEYLRDSITSSDSNAKNKRALIRRLANEVGSVEFSLNSREFTDFEFIPVGIQGEDGYKYNMNNTPLFSSSFHELMIMSPFLSSTVVSEFNNRKRNIENPECILITRQEALSRLKPDQCTRFSLYTMKEFIVDGESAISDDADSIKKQDIHAKIFMWRRYSNSELYLGSLNATHSALNGNIEFVIRISSRNKWLNLKKLTEDLFLGAPDNKDNPFELTSLPESTETEEDAQFLLEKQINNICRMTPSASIEETGETFRINIKFSKLTDVENLYISPLLSNKTEQLSSLVIINDLSLLQLSEFYCLIAKQDEVQIRRIIKIPTENIPERREKALVTDVFKDTRCFYQYISFLLGDDQIMSALENSEIRNSGFYGSASNIIMPALYERMLKTAATSPERFGEIDYILNMVDKEGVVPDGFVEVYNAFKKVVNLRV